MSDPFHNQEPPNHVNLPAGWKATTIGDCVNFSGGTQPPRSTFTFTPRSDNIRLVQIRDYKTEEFATYIPISLARKFCTASDIMIGRYGPPVFQILRGIEGAYNVALIKAIVADDVDREFFYYVLCQDKLFQLIDSLSRRTSGQTGVDMAALKSYLQPLPPLSEQRAIAKALGDVDELIAAQEALIAKKRLIKQGAMQDLLSGHRRLPGFKGEWLIRKIGSLFRPVRSVALSRAQTDSAGDVGYIHYGDIHTKFHDHLDPNFEDLPSVHSSTIRNATHLQEGDWVFADASEDYEGVAKAVEIVGQPSRPCVAGLHTLALRETENAFAPQFKGYVANARGFRTQVLRAATGMKVFGVSKSKMLEIELHYPEDKVEQAAIAHVLQSIDAEITALENKLVKTRDLKQGMMQVLLTGEVRLV